MWYSCKSLIIYINFKLFSRGLLVFFGDSVLFVVVFWGFCLCFVFWVFFKLQNYDMLNKLCGDTINTIGTI